mmetsp:Transcript_32963/g.93377  ORF Transcript_32963/g.93377 Transcript_32963/m.93377 type:complete len:80 (-) Transcript_32963:211-450(-)|eukprot:CAMPEP_0117649132 /NCGR_PEP_ID=MMETSP0804-20121206/801_1 /TAXON_ID=1074897 /ORGANISM="Tetraselmis astigmatica, Strain CCMP880" /LENGTH=79 /DNA_ID=CAMNT_0005454833 /DNA_START=388 /DNA_END=627 /DNA_ORIENTATION=+
MAGDPPNGAAKTNGHRHQDPTMQKYAGPAGWLRKKFFQLEVTNGTYMLEPWEKVVYYVGMSALLLSTGYGLWRALHSLY